MGSKGKICCSTLFWISVLVVCGYLFYIASILPMIFNNHRLRYNQLNLIEIYEIETSHWFNKHIATQGITILTFKQQLEYKYQYSLATFDTINTSNTLTKVSWDEFSLFINATYDINDNNNLYIIQWSSSKCNNTFIQCFEFNYDITNIKYSTDSLIYTPINDTKFININSKMVSQILDDPRDGFMILIGMELIIIIIFIYHLTYTPEFTKGVFKLLLAIAIIFGTYFLWVLFLGLVPVSFSLPMNNKFDYFEMASHSLVYTIGNYNLLIWVIGIIVHGIWAWILTLLLPLIAIIYGLSLCVNCCKQNKADKCSVYMLIPSVGMFLFFIFLISVTYLIVFIINILLWNNVTYNNINDYYIIQILIGIGCIWIVIPVFGFIMSWISNYIANEYSLKIGRSVKAMPIVRYISQRNNEISIVSDENSRDGYDDGYGNGMYENETVGMALYDNYNKNDAQSDDDNYDI